MWQDVAFAETLRSIRSESTVVIIACLTNFLTSSEEAGSSVSFRIGPVLQDALTLINEVALSHADLQFTIAPPLYRLTPLWYRDNISKVLLKFSEVFKGKAGNVHLMPSFNSPVLESDGVHLTAYSGLEFVPYLFDSAVQVLSDLTMTVEDFSVKSAEATRVLEDSGGQDDRHRARPSAPEHLCGVQVGRGCRAL